MIKTKRTKSDNRTIGEDASSVTMRARGLRDEHSHAALQMEVGGFALFLCAARDVKRRVWPGYILYQGAPDAETRRRIREVVGFAVGSGFVYLGSTGLTKASELVWTSAVSGNPFGDRILNHPADPPAPVGSPFEHVLEQGQVSRVAAALFDHYDELDFRALSWAYWHAVCAPGHIAAGHFGAAIEAVQEAYLKAHPEKRLGKVIADPKLATKVRDALNDALAGLPLDAEALSALQSKLAHVNQPSGATVSSRLMKELDLELGPGERGAWKRRHSDNRCPASKRSSTPLPASEPSASAPWRRQRAHHPDRWPSVARAVGGPAPPSFSRELGSCSGKPPPQSRRP